MSRLFFSFIYCFFITLLSSILPPQMHLNSFFSISKPYHFLSISIIFTILWATVLSVNQNFKPCNVGNCGNGPKISYPFWVPNQQQSYCGLPNFEVNCDGKNPVVSISGDKYIIKDIFYSNNSLRLASKVLSNFDNSCPLPLHNFSTETTPFDYSPSYADLFFFYHCTENPTIFQMFPISCASNSTHHSFSVFQIEMLKHHNYSIDSCQSLVNAPVESRDIRELLNMNFTDVLRKGFVLQWNQTYCNDCQRSGGSCRSVDNEFTCFCADKPHSRTCDDDVCHTGLDDGGQCLHEPQEFQCLDERGGRKRRKRLALILGTAVPAVGIMVILLLCIFIKKTTRSESIFFWKTQTEKFQNIEAILKTCGSLSPKRYTYSDIKKITNSFRTKLGQGGFGCVFKGKLENDCLVAVKVLKGLKGNGEEFINEVATISRTSHVNIVTLRGFCFEGRHRALIYEFMPNGSLDKFIHDGGSLTYHQLSWEALYQIVIGIARGLEYLHRGCSTRIVHFDIKPHNILLNEDFCPKISDFGLAKLCPQKESIISLIGARGTAGYIAPEVFSRHFGGVSHKSDVYSYGMMVLEMVGVRKNISAEVDHSSEKYFPHWVYKRLEPDEEFGLHENMDDEANTSARKMIIVGLWCIQTAPSHRPSMSRVVDMLEGSLESLQIPPKPFLASPSRSPVECSSSTLMS